MLLSFDANIFLWIRGKFSLLMSQTQRNVIKQRNRKLTTGACFRSKLVRQKISITHSVFVYLLLRHFLLLHTLLLLLLLLYLFVFLHFFLLFWGFCIFYIRLMQLDMKMFCLACASKPFL